MVSKNYNVNSLFMSSLYGVQNSYQAALQEGTDGVTQKDLLGLNTSTNGILGLLSGNTTASSFSTYLTTNFNQVDKNNDGKITSDEMSTLMTNMSEKGLSYQQLMTMSGTAGVSSDDINNILTNFTKIDRNGDGYVSQTEINYYNANKQINDKLQELKMSRATTSNISIMYGDSDSDDD